MTGRKSYEVSGSLERNIAAVELMNEKAGDGEYAVCFHDISFGDYDGAVLYARNTPLDEVDLEAAEDYNLQVIRRPTGGSPMVVRPDDLIVTATAPGSTFDALDSYLGPAITDSLPEEVDAEVRSDANRRSVWIDGRPVSSFSSTGASPAVLSGYVAPDGFDAEKVSRLVDLREGEREYIDEIPGVSEYANMDGFEAMLRENLSNGARGTLDGDELDRREEELTEEALEPGKGSRHRGFCPVYRDDLEEFRSSTNP